MARVALGAGLILDTTVRGLPFGVEPSDLFSMGVSIGVPAIAALLAALVSR